MAPLPKRRHSRRRGGKRTAAIKLSVIGLLRCNACAALRLPHRACPKCGTYNDRIAIPKREKKKNSSS
ncbi:MAG: 50S ribosomal protein L32 [bacterium]|nr:50S ribosomal protein L32 [bacterium]